MDGGGREKSNRQLRRVAAAHEFEFVPIVRPGVSNGCRPAPDDQNNTQQCTLRTGTGTDTCTDTGAASAPDPRAVKLNDRRDRTRTARGSFHLRIDFSMSNELDQF